MRLLGVDPGGRRMGLATADDATGVVSPIAVVPYHGVAKAVEDIAEAASRHRAELIVVGLPTDADGEDTPACRRSRALVSALRERGLRAEPQAEHLTTHEARARARESGRARQAPVDDLAAAVILEEFLGS